MPRDLGKKVAVLGLGISGYESAVFLAGKKFEVFATDQGRSPVLEERVKKLRALGAEAECGAHTHARILSCDWVLISPGIPPSSEIVTAVRQKNIPIYSEIEVASWFSPTKNIIAVTGSSGKTTVTTLLGRVFAKAKGRSFICGNIGTPWISEISKMTADDYVVVEISSFQLAGCETFKPRAALLLNLSPNHQDWHPDMDDYTRAKLRIFQAQDAGDFAIIRREDQQKFYPDHKFKAKVCYFDGPEGAAVKGANPNEKAVRLTAELFGCGAAVDEVLASFEGIEHRMEKAATAQGVSYINDSKCTTTASLAWALEKFPDGSVVLIAGGHPKSADFDTIQALVRRKVKQAVLIGEARPLLRAAWGKECAVFETDDFREAIVRARGFAKSGDTVLLSPACASFDMFKNYVERGLLFKSIVKEITGVSEKVHS